MVQALATSTLEFYRADRTCKLSSFSFLCPLLDRHYRTEASNLAQTVAMTLSPMSDSQCSFAEHRLPGGGEKTRTSEPPFLTTNELATRPVYHSGTPPFKLVGPMGIEPI